MQIHAEVFTQNQKTKFKKKKMFPTEKNFKTKVL